MNPLLLLALFGGGAYAYVKTKKKTPISYPTDNTSKQTSASGGYVNDPAWKAAVTKAQNATSQEEFDSATRAAKAVVSQEKSTTLPWIQPNRSNEDWLREMSPLSSPGKTDYELVGFIGAYLAGLNAFGQQEITINERDFDTKLKIAGLENRKSEAFVGLANYNKSAPNKVKLNLENGGVAEAYKVNFDEFTKVIPTNNPEMVVSSLPNPKAINNNIGIRVPFGVGGSILTDDKGVATSELGAIGSKGAFLANSNSSGKAQVVAFNTPSGNLLVSYSKDVGGFGRDVHNILRTI